MGFGLNMRPEMGQPETPPGGSSKHIETHRKIKAFVHSRACDTLQNKTVFAKCWVDPLGVRIYLDALPEPLREVRCSDVVGLSNLSSKLPESAELNEVGTLILLEKSLAKHVILCDFLLIPWLSLILPSNLLSSLLYLFPYLYIMLLRCPAWPPCPRLFR